MAGANINISGIKCDSLTCDYYDNNVHVNGYEDWLNKPCPKCGSNLLTNLPIHNTKETPYI